MAKWSDIAKRIEEYARIATFPVGIKYFSTGEEIPKEGRKPGVRQTVCQVISAARVLGRPGLATPDQADRCYVGAYCFGFADLPDDCARGERSFGTYDATPELAKKALSSLARFEKGRFTALLASPLHRITVDPDVIIVYGNGAQIARFVHGWVFMTGEPIVDSTINRGSCSALAVSPYLTQKPHTCLPGNGERVFSSTQDYEVGIGIPASQIEDILVGIEASHASGIRYPVTYNSLDIQPQSFAGFFASPEGPPKSLGTPGQAGIKVLEKYGMRRRFGL